MRHPVFFRRHPLSLAAAALLLAAAAPAGDGQPSSAGSGPAGALAAAAADKHYPIQIRMDMITQAGELAVPERAAELFGIVRNDGAESALRLHALQQIRLLEEKPAGLTEWLTAEAGRQEQSQEWRSVCLSVLDEWFAGAGPHERADIENTLITACTANDQTVSGTALLTMTRLKDVSPRLRDAAADRTGKILLAPGRAPQLTLTALQAAASLKSPDHLPALRAAALDTAGLIRLRLAAVGTLGETGLASDAAVIEEAGDSSALLRRAAGRALAQLDSRFSRPAASN